MERYDVHTIEYYDTASRSDRQIAKRYQQGYSLWLMSKTRTSTKHDSQVGDTERKKKKVHGYKERKHKNNFTLRYP